MLKFLCDRDISIFRNNESCIIGILKEQAAVSFIHSFHSFLSGRIIKALEQMAGHYNKLLYINFSVLNSFERSVHCVQKVGVIVK